MLWILMSGLAVAFGGAYETCDISNGKIFFLYQRLVQWCSSSQNAIRNV